MQNIERKIMNTLMILINISLIVLTIVTFLQVVSRFVFNIPIPWSTDVIRISFVFVIFLSMPVLIERKEHITIDFLTSVLPEKVNKILAVFIDVFVLLFGIILFISSLQLTINSTNQLMPYIQLSMSVVYSVIPFASLLVILYTIVHLLKQISNLIKSRKL